MTIKQRILNGTFLLGLIALASGCIVTEPREGYYDRGQNRIYRGHAWHECMEHEHDAYYCSH
jgi:hypothetical protein